MALTALAVLVALGWILVGIVRRSFVGLELLCFKQRVLESATRDSFRVKEDLSVVVGLEERWGEMYSVGEVAIVSMAFVGTPTGVTRRLGTEKLIFGSG